MSFSGVAYLGVEEQAQQSMEEKVTIGEYICIVNVYKLTTCGIWQSGQCLEVVNIHGLH